MDMYAPDSYKMDKWVVDEFYSELLRMPKMTRAAFGSLKEGDVPKSDDVRIQAIEYLARRVIDRCPIELRVGNPKTGLNMELFLLFVRRALAELEPSS